MEYQPLLNQTRRRRQAGFTLLEVMIYVALFLIILGSVYGLLDSNRDTFASGEVKADVQQNARFAMDEISRQLRVAGYYPENFDADPANDIAGNAVHAATDAAIAIFGDTNAAGASNVALFCLDGSTLRRSIAAAGNVASYTCSNGEALAENVTRLSFAYYGADNAPIPNPPDAPYLLDAQDVEVLPDFADVTQRAAIRRVVISLTVRDDVMRGTPQVYNLTSDIRLRNVN
jgi:prepilin-type N-terminal cleavage/methylation domain-containing protein